MNYYFNTAAASAVSSCASLDSEEEEHFNKRRFRNHPDHLTNAMKNTMKNNNIKNITIEHIGKPEKKGLGHPPYNHQNSNRSDLALVQEKECEGSTSNLQTMMHLLKGNIGTG